MNERPILKLPQTRSAVILNGLAIAGLVALFAVAIHAWFILPDRFPIHFGLDGRPNGWGGKINLIWLPLFGILTYIQLSVSVRYTHTFNYIVPITEANAARQYQIACSMLNWLKAEFIWIYAYTEWQLARLAIAQNPVLDAWFVPIVLVVILGTIGCWMWRSFLAK